MVEVEAAATCISCRSDIWSRIEGAGVLLGWDSKPGRKGVLSHFELVCSELCARRAVSALMQEGTQTDLQPIELWVGPAGYLAFHDLLVTYHVSRGLREEYIPRLLAGLPERPKGLARSDEFCLLRPDGRVSSTFRVAPRVAESA